MSGDFRATVTRLWARLGLPAPTFRAGHAIILEADGVSITLAESPDGRHLLASGTAGRLSADPVRRAEQVCRLLRANLAAVATRRACVSVSRDNDETPAIVVQAMCACDAPAERLTQVIEDVLVLIEAHRGDLHEQPGERTGGTARWGAQIVRSADDNMIIVRP
jgi:hypothetical protein